MINSILADLLENHEKAVAELAIAQETVRISMNELKQEVIKLEFYDALTLDVRKLKRYYM